MKQLSEIAFPVFRKYKNGLSWFRIDSPDSFEEIRLIGSHYVKSLHLVKVHPDRNLLHDLVLHYQDFAVEITAEEYREVAQNVL